nr:unnamed protein product [Callosobruchus analis]
MENERERYTNSQKTKFERLASTKKSTPGLDTDKTVVNISKRNLSEDEIYVLAKGGNFAIIIYTKKRYYGYHRFKHFYKYGREAQTIY